MNGKQIVRWILVIVLVLAIAVTFTWIYTSRLQVTSPTQNKPQVNEQTEHPVPQTTTTVKVSIPTTTPIIIYLQTVSPDTTSVPVTEGENVKPSYSEENIEKPTQAPTQAPTEVPTQAPTETPVPTEVPTPVPTEVPTPVPTEVPTPVPNEVPTPVPTEVPTPVPTEVPTQAPTEVPTPVPTEVPTQVPTEVPTQTPDIGAENFENIQREISKAGCGSIHEVLPKLGGERGYDLYRYIDLSSVDRNQLYECLKNFFVTAVAHSFEFEFSSGNLTSVLSSAYCNNCGKLKLTYVDSNTEEMTEIFNNVNPSEVIDVMLNFMYENTVANESNPNERLFVCCNCD